MAAVASLFTTLLFVISFPKGLQASYEYPFDWLDGIGRRFDGIGAISGGGATSKLLVNYPEPQRSHVLDYLFKPGFGASLQILKVEIGGDAQSSEGTESSHMHYPWDENYSRGYEWWLMAEAKKRNPDILLYGLPWGFPGWISGDVYGVYQYPNVTANYVTRWILGAKKEHNLTIDYVGIWNEKPYDVLYIKTLKRHLVSSGLGHVKIVAADAIGSNAWDIVDDMQSDPELMMVIDIVGSHYTGTWSSSSAKTLNKPLWSSEDFSASANDYGAACMARLLNQNFVNGQMTGFIAWNLITSYYDNLAYTRHSLMVAQQPWGGHYQVTGPVWATAHTTQFANVGWSYLRTGRGSGFLKEGGSYVSLVSPDRRDFTIVIETTDGENAGICLNIPMHKYKVSPQTVVFNLKGPLEKIKRLYMWKSTIDFRTGHSEFFQNVGTVDVVMGSLKLALGVNEVVTLTTIKRGLKGTHSKPPASAPFPPDYMDNFEAYRPGQEAKYFAQQVGSFEIFQTNTAQHRNVLRQVVLRAPNHWCPFTQTTPLTVIGNYQWSDLSVSVDVRTPNVNGSSGAVVGMRVDQGGCTTFVAKGIFMFLDVGRQVVELALDVERTMSIKTVNFVLDPDTWYRVTMHTKGNETVGMVDGVYVYKEVIRSSSPHGFAALGSINFGLVDYDNFHVMALT